MLLVQSWTFGIIISHFQKKSLLYKSLCNGVLSTVCKIQVYQQRVYLVQVVCRILFLALHNEKSTTTTTKWCRKAISVDETDPLLKIYKEVLLEEQAFTALSSNKDIGETTHEQKKRKQLEHTTELFD